MVVVSLGRLVSVLHKKNLLADFTIAGSNCTRILHECQGKTLVQTVVCERKFGVLLISSQEWDVCPSYCCNGCATTYTALRLCLTKPVEYLVQGSTCAWPCVSTSSGADHEY